jgi:hypothetical protein
MKHEKYEKNGCNESIPKINSSKTTNHILYQIYVLLVVILSHKFHVKQTSKFPYQKKVMVTTGTKYSSGSEMQLSDSHRSGVVTVSINLKKLYSSGLCPC